MTGRRLAAVVGPLALIGAAYTPPQTTCEFGGNKFPVLVRAGHRVTVALSPRTRRDAGLGYGPLPTFWSGFVLAASPRCVPLEVWVDDEPSPRRTALSMGVPRCP